MADDLAARVAAVQSLAAAATPGPWHMILSDNATPHITHEGGADWTDIGDETSVIVAVPALYPNQLRNADLMAAAPGIAALVADLWVEVERLRALLLTTPAEEG